LFENNEELDLLNYFQKPVFNKKKAPPPEGDARVLGPQASSLATPLGLTYIDVT